MGKAEWTFETIYGDSGDISTPLEFSDWQMERDAFLAGWKAAGKEYETVMSCGHLSRYVFPPDGGEGTTRYCLVCEVESERIARDLVQAHYRLSGSHHWTCPSSHGPGRKCECLFDFILHKFPFVRDAELFLEKHGDDALPHGTESKGA